MPESLVSAKAAYPGRELAMQGMLDHFAQFLVGMDPRRIEHIWQTLYRGAYFEGGKILGAVISAIDMALWDILGQSLGVPVYQLLGGAAREQVECFDTPGALTGEACVEQAVRSASAGWRHLRFGIGMASAEDEGRVYEPLESLDLAVRWIHAVREAVGSGVSLSIDFHHRLSVAEAALFCQRSADRPPVDAGGADPGAKPASLPAAADDDAGAVRDWRGVFEQVGVPALHRRRPAELRAH